MKIYYLGTAAAEGWPALFCQCENCRRARKAGGKNLRTRPQALINDNLLMDFGPDTFSHAMKYGIDMAKVETVLMTHSHTDHWYPQELILRGDPYAFLDEERPMLLYGNSKCRATYERMLVTENDSQNLRERIGFELTWEFQPFHASGYEITPLKAIHDRTESCLLYVIRDQEGKTLLYGNDTGYFPEATWEYIKDMHFDLVSLDCTCGAQRGHYGGHMGVVENRMVRERMLQMGCADEKTVFIMTHFSHNGGLLHEELEERGKEIGFQVAYDGMLVEI